MASPMETMKGALKPMGLDEAIAAGKERHKKETPKLFEQARKDNAFEQARKVTRPQGEKIEKSLSE